MTKDGYPTKKELDYIKNYNFITKPIKPLLDYIQDLWTYDKGFRLKEKEGNFGLVLRTGGWSGNEDIIRALEANSLFYPLWWVKSERGGKYTFDIRAIGVENDLPIKGEIDEDN